MEIRHKFNNHNTYQASMQRVYEKRNGLEDSNAIGDTDVFGVVPIGGAIVHPR